MAEIPRALGFTDNQIQEALAVSTQTEEGNVMNPFSSMGISDADYLNSAYLPFRRCPFPLTHTLTVLQGIALEKEGKKGLEVVQGNGEGKRARFQEVGEV